MLKILRHMYFNKFVMCKDFCILTIFRKSLIEITDLTWLICVSEIWHVNCFFRTIGNDICNSLNFDDWCFLIILFSTSNVLFVIRQTKDDIIVSLKKKITGQRAWFCINNLNHLNLCLKITNDFINLRKLK